MEKFQQDLADVKKRYTKSALPVEGAQSAAVASANLLPEQVIANFEDVRDHAMVASSSPAVFFDEQLQTLQKEYARKLLTHKHPYTGLEYRHKPAVAFIEVANESSLVWHWLAHRLKGQNTKEIPSYILFQETNPGKRLALLEPGLRT